MPKNDKRDNWRVEVEPAFGSGQRECEHIAASIRRHVDFVARVVVLSDPAPECSYCGAWWTEDSPDYNGGCCDKEEAHNPSPEVSHAE